MADAKGTIETILWIVGSLIVSFFVITYFLAPQVFAEEELGVSEGIDSGFDSLDSWFADLIKKAELTGTETPLNTTEDELMDLLDDSVQTGKDGKNFLFSFHHLIESAIKAVAPIDIDPVFVLIISAIVAMIVVWKITKGSASHLMLFGMLFGIVILLFMIGGINPEFN